MKAESTVDPLCTPELLLGARFVRAGFLSDGDVIHG